MKSYKTEICRKLSLILLKIAIVAGTASILIEDIQVKMAFKMIGLVCVFLILVLEIIKDIEVDRVTEEWAMK